MITDHDSEPDAGRVGEACCESAAVARIRLVIIRAAGSASAGIVYRSCGQATEPTHAIVAHVVIFTLVLVREASIWQRTAERVGDDACFYGPVGFT